LPPINTEITITSQHSKEEEEEEEDIEELRKRIEELSKQKENEVNDLENLNTNLHDYENKIIENKFNVDAEKSKLKHDKEKWEEFKNIFNADKKIYKIMKEQFENNEIDEIPELFEKKYPIFSVLDDHGILDTSSEIYEYIKLLPEDDSVYIPKNIALKGLFNDNIISSISLTELQNNNPYETTIETDEE
jgi:chromosome segregation ATPase